MPDESTPCCPFEVRNPALGKERSAANRSWCFRVDLEMRYVACFAALLFCLMFTQCKKSRQPVTFSGQLLLSKKYPQPVANRVINLFQNGSNALIMGSSAASASGSTDANGRFSITFTPGESYFVGSSSANSAPISLSTDYSDTAFPAFIHRSFTGDNNTSTPIYIGKIVDTALIKILLTTNLLATDTIGLQALTRNGPIDRKYSGLSGISGSTIVLDTVTNLLFTDYDGNDKQFSNTIQGGRKYTVASGYSFIQAHQAQPERLTTTDTTRQEFFIYFYR
jgi:hypothetical protein